MTVKFKTKQRKKLSPADREMLWNNGGPYSEAKIIFNTRILDDRVSRVMVEVEGHINPTTFRLVEKHKEQFADDPMIIQLLATAVYQGKAYGYCISAGEEEYTSEGSWQRVDAKLEYMKKSIIKMHTFVMENYKF